MINLREQTKDMRTTLFLFGLMFYPAAALAEPDVLLQAVSFAITGSDASKVVAINRQQCIFKVENYAYHLNRIYTDRITFQSKKDRVWVEIHGKTNVVDLWDPPAAKDDGSERMREMKASMPEVFLPTTQSLADYTIEVVTTETDRLKRAWEYIYANGCKGMTSPF
jgi:hypothetical protein